MSTRHGSILTRAPGSFTCTQLRSLLRRLKDAGPDDTDWLRLQEIYLPLIRAWLCRVPGLGDEANDLAQDVFVVVVRELPAFERWRDGAFRAWFSADHR